MEDLSSLKKALPSPQPVNSDAGSQETSTASANQVVRTYELREIMFENFEVHDLVISTLVCKLWQHHILTTKQIRRRLALSNLTPTRVRDLKVNDWINRFGLQFHTRDRIHSGALLLGQRQEVRFALCVWYNQAFSPPENEKVWPTNVGKRALLLRG